MSYQYQDRNEERRNYEEWHRYGKDRGFFDRAADEIRSWFGDEEAERRRQEDQQIRMRGYNGDTEYGSQKSRSGRDSEPEWQRRDYSGPSPRGSNFEERGRYDEQDLGGGRGQHVSSSRHLKYGAERYEQPRFVEPGHFRNERPYGEEQRYVNRYGSSGMNRETQPRFFEEGRDFESRMPMGERWGGIDPSERTWMTEGRHRGRGPRNYQRSDERISDEIHQFLTFHPELDATDVDIIVETGIVTLRGAVDSRAAKRLAEDIAEEVFGVKEVHNELRVNRGDFQKPMSQTDRERSTLGSDRSTLGRS